MGQDAWEWLEKVCGLSPDRCQSLGVRAVRHGVHGSGLAFPYRSLSGGVVGELGMFQDDAWSWDANGNPGLLFGIDDVANEALADHPVILTQDPLDALAVKEAGFPRACATPGPWSAENEEPVIRAITHGLKALRNSPRVIVAAKAGEAGDAFTHGMAAVLDPHPVHYTRYPSGGSPRAVLAHLGASELARCLNDAARAEPPTGIISGFSDLPPLASRHILRPGLDKIDNAVAFEQQAMSVCTGIPGNGKSTFVRFVAHHLTRNEGVCIGAMEMEGNPRKMRDHLARLTTGHAFADLSPKRQDEVARGADQHWRVVHRPRGVDGAAENLEWLHDRVRQLATRMRCRFIYADPWNEFEHLPAPGESLTNYINYATKCIRQWAERYDTHICIIAHPKKLYANEAPDGYSIADSAAWANKPALGFTVHHEEADPDEGYPEPHVSLRTWKVRDVEAYGFGKGMLRLQFNPGRMSYAPLYKSRFAADAAR